MTEHEGSPPREIAAVHIILEATDGTETRLTLKPEGMFLLLSQVAGFTGAAITERSVNQLVTQGEATATSKPESKEETITVSGRLKGKPRAGRPDRNNKPTAWALLAAHEEGSDVARMWSATFYRHTAAIALKLDLGDQVTVQGYPRPNDDPSRNDGLAIFNLLNYPGKPEKASE
jgi:hypothetical protein